MTPAVRETGRALLAPRVLMYHFFGEPVGGTDSEHQFVTAARFRSQVGGLLTAGWRAVDLDEYLGWWAGAVRLPPRSFLLTIDDGHRSVVDVAAPELARLGVPSVLFVPSGLVGGHVTWAEEYAAEPIATAEELARLPSLGMELGVHGHDHARMVPMSGAELRVHTRVAREALRALTGVSARAFAYPYGTHDDAARRAVAEAGYEVAFAVAREHGRMGRWRICVDGDDAPLSFRFKLTPAYAGISLAAGRTWRLRHLVRDGVAAVRRPAATPSAGHR